MTPTEAADCAIAEAIHADRDKEAARWQTSIEATIRRFGLEPIDASGNESGDPLDWSLDQIAAAICSLCEERDAAKEVLATALITRGNT